MIPLSLTFGFISGGLDDYWFITLLDDNIVGKNLALSSGRMIINIWLDDNIAMSHRCYDLIGGQHLILSSEWM
jgi:hypothetical protein